MKNAIGVVVTAGLAIGVCAPAKAQNLEGTLQKVKETGIITINPVVIP